MIMLKALVVLKIFTFLSRAFVQVGKWLDQKVNVNFKIFDVPSWTTHNYNAHIAQYLKK